MSAQLKTNSQSTFASPAILYLPQMSGLLQPSETLFDQPAAAQTDGIAGLPHSSPVQSSHCVETTDSAPASINGFTRLATSASRTGPTPVSHAESVTSLALRCSAVGERSIGMAGTSTGQSHISHYTERKGRMRLLCCLVLLFIDAFGITHPSREERDRAARYIAFRMIGLLVTISCVFSWACISCAYRPGARHRLGNPAPYFPSRPLSGETVILPQRCILYVCLFVNWDGVIDRNSKMRTPTYRCIVDTFV